ncbi:MAG: WxcM-like domain-containing protein [Planctomyces sp.]|nr:WxcM-like domain-containing protein [Planctomyces sp.]
MGIDLNVEIHERAVCESSAVGTGTRIRAFSRILAGAVIGEACEICDQVLIENDVIIGNRVIIKSGVQLWNGLRIGDDVYIGPNASFANDRIQPNQPLITVLDRNCTVGTNATILPGVRIGRHATVNAGAVVTRSVPPYAIVAGNPARVVGYDDSVRPTLPRAENPVVAGDDPKDIVVPGVRLLRLPQFQDMRGALVPIEFTRDLPFVPVRCFNVFGVENKRVRGEHAHRTCHQFLISLTGSCRVLVDNASVRQVIRLSSPTQGLYVPPMIWASQHHFSPGTVLMVLASHPYQPDDYIRDFDAYCNEMSV